MTGPSMTVSEAAEAMVPPIPRRELARRLKGVPPVGTRYGALGRKPKLYPVAAIMLVHAEWVREKAGRLQVVDQSCQNADGQNCVPGQAS